MMRKQHRFLPKIGQFLLLCIGWSTQELLLFPVAQCLQFMLEVEDDPDWLTVDVINEDEDMEG